MDCALAAGFAPQAIRDDLKTLKVGRKDWCADTVVPTEQTQSGVCGWELMMMLKGAA